MDSSKGKISIVEDEVFSIIRFFTYSIGLLSLFNKRKVRFKVTPKDDSKAISLYHLAGPLLIFIISLTTIVYALISIFTSINNYFVYFG